VFSFHSVDIMCTVYSGTASEGDLGAFKF